MLPRDERDIDFADRRLRETLRPVGTLAIEREIAQEKASQVLVDNIIQIEQNEFQPVIPIQEHPGELTSPPPPLERIIHPNGAWTEHQQELEGIIVSEPEKVVDPVKTVPLERTTVDREERVRMGVPVIESTTKLRAVPKAVHTMVPGAPGYEEDIKRRLATQENAFGLNIEERVVKDTPVQGLNLLDQFFNWLNAFLGG